MGDALGDGPSRRVGSARPQVVRHFPRQDVQTHLCAFELVSNGGQLQRVDSTQGQRASICRSSSR
jgi:hypothetical protein